MNGAAEPSPVTIPAREPGMLRRLEGALRRMIDLIISSLGMVLLFPAYLAILLKIKSSDHGPAVIKEERVGKNGRTILVHKFRTTVDKSGKDGSPGVNNQVDPKITPFGRYLRDTRLDEIPSLWNVFIGDLSLAGPRPEDRRIVMEWPEEIRREILSVRPGMASPGSLLYRNMEVMLLAGDLSERYLLDILPGKLRLDLLYIRLRNLISDLDVVCWTAATMLPRMRDVKFSDQRNPRHLYVSFFNRPVVLFSADFLVTLLSVGVVGVLVRLNRPLNIGFDRALGMALIIALVYSLVNLLAGFDRGTWVTATVGEALDLAIFTGLVMLILFIAERMFPGGFLLPPTILVLSAGLALAGFIGVRYRTRLISGLARRWIDLTNHDLSQFGERVLIIGAGETGRYAIRLMREGLLAQSFNLIGIIDDDRSKLGTKIEGLEVIGNPADIPNIVVRRDIGLALIAVKDIQAAESDRIIQTCRGCNLRVIMVPDVIDSLGAFFQKGEGEWEELAGRVLQDTRRDRITGAYNRQAFTLLVEHELMHGFQYNHTCSLIAFEVRYHWPDGAARSRAVTSQVLQVAADRILKRIHDDDLIGRYGENEFGILLPRTDEESAFRLAERIQKQLAATPIWTDRGPLNISVGMHVLTQRGDSSDAETMLKKAFQQAHLSPSESGPPDFSPECSGKD